MASPCALVVEPAEAVRAVARRLLEALGWRTAGAGAAASAFARLRAGGVQAVLLDFALPDGRGAEAVRTVREEWPDLPLVVTCGFLDEEILAATFGGGVRTLLKPYGLDELRRLLPCAS